MKIYRIIRSVILNLVYFKSFTKKIYFGRNVRIVGNVSFGSNITLDDNVEIRNRTKTKSYIGKGTSINRNTVCRGNFVIGQNCAIAPNCTIVGANHIFSNPDKCIKFQGVSAKGINIEDDVWIGANCVVLDGVTIGKGSVIGAGSVVVKNIPPYSVAVGNPCKVIKQRK
jgi:acetyltransferase-like isoleucine patch superfamily enzyme